MSIGYKGTISEFLANPDKVMTDLAKTGANYCVLKTQSQAWVKEINMLQEILPQISNQNEGRIFFEYEIPRMNKRVDVVLLLGGVLFVLEYKVSLDDEADTESYTFADCEQVADYALEFSYFHSESHFCPIVPILIKTGVSKYEDSAFVLQEYNVYDVQRCNSSNSLKDIISRAIVELPHEHRLISYDSWVNGDYEPTPTIVEVSEALYANHSVEEITRSGAGAEGIKAATKTVNEIIDYARTNNKKVICFLTGVPGAGKTLVGINIASSRDESGANRVFLSGNYPLVKVLQEALIKNRQTTQDLIKARLISGEDLTDYQKAIVNTIEEQCKIKVSAKPSRKGIFKVTGGENKKKMEAQVKTKIQLVPNFRSRFDETNLPPNEHVFIFDEAQRAWSAKKVKKEEKRTDGKSEPDILLSYLDRHQDWCVAIALVGTGQDIHDGEAGIDEWYETLSSAFRDWEIYTAAETDTQAFQEMKSFHTDRFYLNAALHLDHPMRSFRAKDVSTFIEAMLNGQAGIENAKLALKKLNAVGDDGRVCFPLYITRDVEAAKNKIRSMAKGSERYGALISSKAKRLRRYGLFALGQDFDQVAWFLDDKNSIDSSFSMEVAASEFKVQGLEIDYALVGWDGDYKYDKNTGCFICRKFSVSKGEWMPISGQEADIEIRHLINAYRVILTRARQGMVIFVPTGDISKKDKTVPPEAYDETYEFLKSIGISEL